MTNLSRVSALALSTACLLAACSKSPQEMGCDDTSVQTDVRKLLAVKLRGWQEPVNPVSWAQSTLTQQNPEMAATLNGLKAKSARIEHISLANVEELAPPQTPLADADPPDAGFQLPTALRPKKTGNKLLYQCAGTAKLPLPHERVADLPEISRQLFGIEQDAVTQAVRYQTELTPEGRMWVAVSLAHPLAEIAPRSVLAEPEHKTAQE